MNLNIEYLLKNLAENTREIIWKIHCDPKLTKRYCEVNKLWIANAAKDLFTPEYEHQLYAKGIVYHAPDTFNLRDCGDLSLVSLPMLKMYNYSENQDVKTHLSDMISQGADPIYTQKYDGSLIQRFTWQGKVVLATRGMIETMAENDEQKQYFNWARKIIAEKYPKIDNPNYLMAGTSIFELIGPDNQIVTHYPNFDLVMIGYCDLGNCATSKLLNSSFRFPEIEYWPHKTIVSYCNEYNYANPVTKLYVSGNTIEDQIKSIDKLFANTDDEGSVIQFEKLDHNGVKRVVGRIKAKTENYRHLLKMMKNCSYDTVSDLIKSDVVKYLNWQSFEEYLKSQGSEKFPEELMEVYKQHHSLFKEHWYNCAYFLRFVEIESSKILESSKGKIKFDYDDKWIPKIKDKDSRTEFAKAASKWPYSGCLFAYVDGKLDLVYIMDRVLKNPEDSAKAIEVLSK